MAIRGPCPLCGANLTLADSDAGTTVTCPHCSGSVAIPPAPSRQNANAQPPDVDIWKSARVAGRGVRGVAWGICLAWTMLVTLGTWAALPRAQSAVQEASLAAMAAVSLIAGYVVARCIHELTRAGE